jgi:hypothetical protein
VAQSWASTWHPVVGSRFVKNLYGFTGVEPPTYSLGNGLAGPG